jgi:hypothetical protein
MQHDVDAFSTKLLLALHFLSTERYFEIYILNFERSVSARINEAILHCSIQILNIHHSHFSKIKQKILSLFNSVEIHSSIPLTLMDLKHFPNQCFEFWPEDSDSTHHDNLIHTASTPLSLSHPTPFSSTFNPLLKYEWQGKVCWKILKQGRKIFLNEKSPQVEITKKKWIKLFLRVEMITFE